MFFTMWRSYVSTLTILSGVSRRSGILSSIESPLLRFTSPQKERNTSELPCPPATPSPDPRAPRHWHPPLFWQILSSKSFLLCLRAKCFESVYIHRYLYSSLTVQLLFQSVARWKVQGHLHPLNFESTACLLASCTSDVSSDASLILFFCRMCPCCPPSTHWSLKAVKNSSSVWLLWSYITEIYAFKKFIPSSLKTHIFGWAPNYFLLPSSLSPCNLHVTSPFLLLCSLF